MDWAGGPIMRGTLKVSPLKLHMGVLSEMGPFLLAYFNLPELQESKLKYI